MWPAIISEKYPYKTTAYLWVDKIFHMLSGNGIYFFTAPLKLWLAKNLSPGFNLETIQDLFKEQTQPNLTRSNDIVKKLEKTMDLIMNRFLLTI